MKTNLVFRTQNNGQFQFNRAVVADESDKEARRLHHISIAKYAEPETVRRSHLDMRTMRISKPRTVNIPEGIQIYGHQNVLFHFTRGKCENVRFIREEHQAELDALDLQIEHLEQCIAEIKAKRRKMSEHAFYCGRSVRRNEILPKDEDHE